MKNPYNLFTTEEYKKIGVLFWRDVFTNLYSDYKIPFWMNTRAETITEYRAESLEEMNMLRMNIGIEHGNFEYRKLQSAFNLLWLDIIAPKSEDCNKGVSPTNTKIREYFFI